MKNTPAEATAMGLLASQEDDVTLEAAKTLGEIGRIESVRALMP